MKLPFNKMMKLATTRFTTGGRRPKQAPGQTRVQSGEQVPYSKAQDSKPDDVLRVINQPRKTTVLLSPFMAEDYSAALAMRRYSTRCVRDSVNRGESPVASHLFYYDHLNVKLPIERDIGLMSQLSWIKKCDIVVVYADFGITPAMKVGINTAILRNKKIEFRVIGDAS